jgi:hypothetical protein
MHGHEKIELNIHHGFLTMKNTGIIPVKKTLMLSGVLD